MLTRLRFKNWRSLRDVEINDLTPLTVFIGANSSGKTNIIEALRFHRDSLIKGLVQVVLESGYHKIQTDGFENDDDVELEFTYKLDLSSLPITEKLVLQFDKRDVPFKFADQLYEAATLLRDNSFRELPVRDAIQVDSYDLSQEKSQQADRARQLLNYLYPLIQKRWQILSDSFSPPLRLSHRDGGDLYVIEPDAHNVLLILDFMQRTQPEIYSQLKEDLHWLLSHVTSREIWQQPENRELEILVREAKGKSVPTVSSGTARLIAMLTAFYALDMPQESISPSFTPQILKPDMPGLVVIEEPDTALNPGVLRNFVEQLRNYTEGDKPRQFIMTTHNPAFLDFFKPEEVRIVERDEQGYTTVRKVPEPIKDIWLDEYGLGEVWLTRSLGGVPE